MRSLFNNFLSLLNSLGAKFTQVSWEEEFDTLFVVYEGLSQDIKEFFGEIEYEELLKETHISFKFVIDESSPIFDEEFINSRPYIQDNKNVTLTVSVNKEVTFNGNSNVILFLNLDSFNLHYRIQSEKFISFFTKIDQASLLHIFLPVSETFQNNFVKIIPYEELGTHSMATLDEKDLKEVTNIKENREEFTRINSFYPLPHLFAIETNDENLNQLFHRNLFLSSLMHIANKYKENKFIIRGQKNLELPYDESFIPMNAPILYSIFKFSFGKEQTQDKIEITRNIITIYLHKETIEQFDTQLDKMKQTIERHFSMYVQDKIKNFFDNTKDAIDLAHKYALEAREAADKIATNISTSILALITAVFSGIVIMAKGNFLFLVLALVLHILYFILSYSFNMHFALKKKKDITDIYDLTNKNFSNISPEEREDIKKNYVNPAIDSIKINLKKYFWLTASLIIFMVLLIVGAYFFQDVSVNKPNQTNQVIKKESKPENNKTETLSKELEKKKE